MSFQRCCVFMHVPALSPVYIAAHVNAEPPPSPDLGGGTHHTGKEESMRVCHMCWGGGASWECPRCGHTVHSL